MELYKSTAKSFKDRMTNDGENLFLRQVKDTFDGYYVIVDSTYNDIPMLIQKHTNPLNKNKHDMKAKYLNSTGDFMHLGNIITIPENGIDYKYYMAITEPSTNGIYSEYKILPLTDDIRFNIDTPVNMKCIIADKGLYDEVSYINEQNVFEDKDLRAAVIQYNENTNKLNLFDDVYINDSNYRIVKIDNYTLKEYDEEFGVLQLVLVDAPFGTIIRNDDSTPIKGVVMTARVKDKILNSISRELICEHNKVERGDYIYFTYDRDKLGNMTTETYITINKPSMGDRYDISLMYLCENTMNLLNDKGEVVKIPLYFEDNRTRIDKTSEGEYISLMNSSFLFVCQDNAMTRRIIDRKVKRIIVDGLPYEITGFNPNSKGLISLGVELSQFGNGDNIDLGIADYDSQMAEINKGDTTKPTMGILEVNGEEYLYPTFTNTYYLSGEQQYVSWFVDVDWVTLEQFENGRCTLRFDNKYDIDKKIKLTSRYGIHTFTRDIYTKGFAR